MELKKKKEKKKKVVFAATLHKTEDNRCNLNLLC